MAESTSNAGATTDGARTRTGETRLFPCERCGADLEWTIGKQRLACPYCGFAPEPAAEPSSGAIAERPIAAVLNDLAARKKAAAPVTTVVTGCTACGAQIQFEGTVTAQSCPYCGQPTQRAEVHTEGSRLPVDALLAFSVPRERAHEDLRAWVKSRWFAPNAFLRAGVEGKFAGVYLPFFTFDAMTKSDYVGERGEAYYVTVGSGKNQRRERRVRWYPAAGHLERFFDDVLVCAASRAPQQLVHTLEPWPLARAQPFTAAALQGFLAMTYDASLEQCFADAKARMEDEIQEDVRHGIGGDEQRVHSIRTAWAALTYKHVLLPVWMMTYRFKEKPYQVVVNAVTGEVQGERPYSAFKIAVAVVLGALVAGAIAWAATQAQ